MELQSFGTRPCLYLQVTYLVEANNNRAPHTDAFPYQIVSSFILKSFHNEKVQLFQLFDPLPVFIYCNAFVFAGRMDLFV